MNRKTIGVILANDYENENWNSNNRFRGTFLHGEIESDLGYDIFCFTEKLELRTGIHMLKINEKNCTFFLWEPESTLRFEWRGLLVYDNDVPSYDYGLKCFNEKEDCL